MTEIKLKNGVVVKESRHSVWMTEDSKGWTTLGYFHKAHWNFHDISHVSWGQKERYPVPKVMLGLSKRFGYKFLRMEFLSNVSTPRGRRMKVLYGYISIIKLERIAEKRKVVKGFCGMNYILLYGTDFEFESR